MIEVTINEWSVMTCLQRCNSTMHSCKYGKDCRSLLLALRVYYLDCKNEQMYKKGASWKERGTFSNLPKRQTYHCAATMLWDYHETGTVRGERSFGKRLGGQCSEADPTQSAARITKKQQEAMLWDEKIWLTSLLCRTFFFGLLQLCVKSWRRSNLGAVRAWWSNQS